MRFGTHYNYEYHGIETPDQTQVTVPDMSYSVQDIIDNFTRGTFDVTSIQRPFTDDHIPDDEVDNIPSIPSDITDVEDVVRTGADIVDKLRREAAIRQTEKVAEESAIQSEAISSEK